MPLIEGVGDEVTLILGGFLLCIVLMLAWLSTHTADIPLLREVGVIVVELSQRRSRVQNAVREEQLERDGAGSSIERDATVERQQSEVDHGSSETSETQLRPRSVSDNSINAVEVEPTTPSPLLNESSDLQAGAADATTSRAIVPEHAGTLSDTPDNTSAQVGQSSDNQAVSDNLSDTETFVPKATVVVDDNKGFVYPSEEEVRQRRVQYFQANKTEQTIKEESATYSSSEDIGSSSLSETSTSGSYSIRHLTDNHFSSYPPTLNQTETAGVSTKEGAAVNSTIPHQVDDLVEDSSNIATSSLHEDITDVQSIQDENSPSKIRVKLKYMNETQRLVLAEPLDTIGEFRRTHFQTELQDNKWVRFIYNGQDLRDDARTLQACNIGDNSTMHCLITAQVQPHLPRATVPDDEEDSFMGAMMYPLFTVIILIVWYFRFTYRQYFSAMSTVCLIGISFLLALSYISSLRTADRVIPAQRTGPTLTAAAEGSRAQEEHQHVD